MNHVAQIGSCGDEPKAWLETTTVIDDVRRELQLTRHNFRI